MESVTYTNIVAAKFVEEPTSRSAHIFYSFVDRAFNMQQASKVEQVVEICKRKLRAEELLTANSLCLCLDGTSSCFKSTILKRLESRGYNVSKVQQNHTMINQNSYPPTTLGYTISGIVDSFMTDRKCFVDRSFLNSYEWNLLWRYMDLWYQKFDNVAPNMSNNQHAAFISQFIRWVEQLRQYPIYKYYKDQINCIVIINSNCTRVDEVRTKRAEGSDIERSTWKFYTFLQNVFYKTLYEDLCIDLAWFQHFSFDITIEGLVNYLEYAIKFLKRSIVKPCEMHQLSMKIPSSEKHYSSINMNTHVYRSKLRAYRDTILAIAEGNVDDSQNFYQKRVEYFVPKYVKIDDNENATAPIVDSATNV